MADRPSWLDPKTKTTGSSGAPGIQCAEPSSVVLLVTHDMNLQNKAEMAFLPGAEPLDFGSKLLSALPA
jgi:hypothetical protein